MYVYALRIAIKKLFINTYAYIFIIGFDLNLFAENINTCGNNVDHSYY